MTEHAVLIAGGGPTGLVLAGELALARVDVAIVERRTGQELVGQRSGGLHARTLELFDQRGLAERFLSHGKLAQVAAFSGVPLDISDFPTRRPYGLALWQVQIERILAGWVAELGVPTYRRRAVTGFAQDGGGVDVALSDGTTLRAAYLVGCDGGRSVVRKAAGIAFPGSDATTSNLIAEAELAQEPPAWGIRRDALGLHGLSKADDGRHVRILVTEREVGPAGEPTLDELREGLKVVYGTDFGVHSPVSLARFTDTVRQAAAYRAGRVLLAGDAAHVHPPDGGQGLQLGVQDAVNLGWKLAQVVRGTSPESLLDTYQVERHPTAACVLRTTLASVALRREDERAKALREVMTELLRMHEPRKRLAALYSGLDIRYELGDGHPLVGWRMPDLDLETAGGPVRVYSLLHTAQGVLLDLGPRAPGGSLTAAAATRAGAFDRVRTVEAAYDGPWELPVIGKVPAPAAVLIRPDGHVAWAGEIGDSGLPRALRTWFGA